MKKIIGSLILILSIIALGCNENELKTCSGDYVITQKSQLNSLLYCSEITGDLTIEGTSLTELSGLNMLRTVSNLIIQDNPSLINLVALNNLISIDKNLVIRNNDSLQVFGGLRLLNRVNGELVIEDNDSLLNLDDIDKLLMIGNSLSIQNNINLADCEIDKFLDRLGNRSSEDDIISGNNSTRTCD